MKWLITGGLGFIGSNLSARLMERGHDVVILDNLSRDGSSHNYDWLRDRHPSKEFRWWPGNVEASLYTENFVGDSLPVDVVLHLAAQVAVTRSIADPRADFMTNVLGTLNVLEAVRKHAPNAAVIYASTNKIYGDLPGIPLVEQEDRYSFAGPIEGVREIWPAAPVTPYACSKMAGEQYVRDYSRTYNLRTTAFRLSAVYGPRQWATQDQGWATWIARRMIQGDPVTVFGDGKQTRDLLWIDDLVDLFILAAENFQKVNGRAFNVGGGPGNVLSINQLIKMLIARVGPKSQINYVGWRKGDQKIYISDNSEIHKAIPKWWARNGVEKGIDRLIEWLRGDGNRAFLPGEGKRGFESLNL